MANKNYGTTVKSGMAAKAASTSGVKHGPSVPNGGTSGKAKSHMGKGSAGVTNPIKGSNKGGVK